jgi:cytochrome c biogenesis protein CcmG/thiol:disulfide interchange protein DsbE
MRRTATTLAVSLVAIALVALLVFGVLQTSDDTSIDQAVARGEKPAAHDARLPQLDRAGSRALADYRAGGRVVVLSFFASWCHPCADEAPLLNRLQRRLGERGRVVGVAWDDTIADARDFVARYDVSFPVLRDVDGAFGRAYGITAMPETFLLDAQGRIVALKRSQLTPEWIAEEIDPLVPRREATG